MLKISHCPRCGARKVRPDKCHHSGLGMTFIYISRCCPDLDEAGMIGIWISREKCNKNRKLPELNLPKYPWPRDSSPHCLGESAIRRTQVREG